LNWIFHFLRRKLGFPFWPLSQFIMTRTKKAMQYIRNFKSVVVHAAQYSGVDDTVCDHINHPIVKQMNGILYANTGDWVENWSMVVEHIRTT